ncbi:hypothetical protein [Amycolatopsis pithecellobii]|uniref:Uncharacterized protein n=1 Tax=Amycolatopsis pithecellobii TaxID=664692 RepID=A0A6N7Z1U2_9PSEU|nr:hypothetical protein [Amycolatopsis pithecellobii]MTD53871.1 hypothetical protein [Amycolatopsis pithecellobii]
METIEISESAQLYARMSQRASTLCEQLDDAINALLGVHQTVREVARADLDVMGELSATDSADLVQYVESALFSSRGAERIALSHQYELRRWATRKSATP